MKSFPGKFASVRGWALFLALFLGAGMLVSACGDEEVPAPTTPTPAPAPAPAPEPPPEPEPTGPAVPTNVRMTDSGSDYIEWSWDAVEGALGYQAEFSKDEAFTTPSNPFIIIAPNTSQRVSGLDPNMTGYFRVRSGAGTSLDALTYSDWSETSSGKTGDPPPATKLDAPSGISGGDRQDDSITVTWDEVDDAASYEVQQRASGGSWEDASCGDGGNAVEETECVATGLTSGTSYDFRVRAVPADSIAHATSDWATISDAVETTGNAPTDPTSGGMGALNVRWQNNITREIVFIWDRQGESDYESAVIPANISIYDEDPCAEIAAASYVGQGSATSQNLPSGTPTPGTVVGLCVRTEGGSDASFAWGITPGEEPVPQTPVLDEGRTTELSWNYVNIEEGFDYEIRLAADPELPKRDNKITSGAGGTLPNDEDKVVQKACDAGAVVEQFYADRDLTNRTVAVDRGLKPNTGYLLCVRASNTAGASSWAVSTTDGQASGQPTSGYGSAPVQETFTRPAAPPSPRLLPNPRSIEAAGSENEKLAPQWEILTQNTHEVPRDAADFTLRVVVANAADAASLKKDDCSAASAPTNYTQFTPDKRDDIPGFTVTVQDDNAIERDFYTRKVYLCAQADNGDGNGYGEGPWTISSAYNVSKPSGLSASVSFKGTRDATNNPVVYNVDAKITVKSWNKSWSYDVAIGTGTATCTENQSGETVDVTWSSVPLSEKRTVRVFASANCTDGTRLTTSSYTAPGS